MDNSEEQKHIQENNGFARIEPYTHPAGGWGALLSVARNLKRQDILKKVRLPYSILTSLQGSTVPVVHGQKRKMLMPLTSVKTAQKQLHLKQPVKQ